MTTPTTGSASGEDIVMPSDSDLVSSAGQSGAASQTTLHSNTGELPSTSATDNAVERESSDLA